jgi:hypothetical protein
MSNFKKKIGGGGTTPYQHPVAMYAHESKEAMRQNQINID